MPPDKGRPCAGIALQQYKSAFITQAENYGLEKQNGKDNIEA